MARIYAAVNGLFFYTTLVENEVLLVFVTFNWSLSLNILNSPSSEDLIPSVHVSVMLIFSNIVKNLSISLDKRTEIC